jgi:hypothetical protein
MEQAPRHPGLCTGRVPRLATVFDPLAVAMEHERHDPAGLPQPVVDGLLRHQDRFQRRGEGEGAAFVILRRAGLQANRPALPIDLPPLERHHLGGEPPTGEVVKRQERPQRRRQVRLDGRELRRLEESAPHVVFLQHRNVRPDVEPAGLDRQRVGALDDRELAVDLRGDAPAVKRSFVKVRMSAVVMSVMRRPRKAGSRCKSMRRFAWSCVFRPLTM